jgi:hypothetical protein
VDKGVGEGRGESAGESAGVCVCVYDVLTKERNPTNESVCPAFLAIKSSAACASAAYLSRGGSTSTRLDMGYGSGFCTPVQFRVRAGRTGSRTPPSADCMNIVWATELRLSVTPSIGLTATPTTPSPSPITNPVGPLFKAP